MRLVHRVWCDSAVAAAMVALALPGCMGALTSDGPSQVEIAHEQYTEAFDAAAKATREMGYEIELVDRSNGIIESKPRHAGGAFEPWRIDNSGPTDAAANTVAHRRRKIRIEFTPVGFTLDAGEPDPVLRGPAIPGSSFARNRFDLTTSTGPIEMKVWVFVERSFQEGAKPSPYSGTLASRWTNPISSKPSDASDASIRDPSVWTPVGRDEAYERTLGGRIEGALCPQGAAETPRAEK